MLSGVLTLLTALQPITTLSSFGLTQSLPPPGAVAWKALAQDWSAENNWLCPPVHLIIDSVCHLKSCSGRGTLIIPEWLSASFFLFVLPAISHLLLEGPGQRQIYASRPSVFRGCPKFRMLALRLDFR